MSARPAKFETLTGEHWVRALGAARGRRAGTAHRIRQAVQAHRAKYALSGSVAAVCSTPVSNFSK